MQVRELMGWSQEFGTVLRHLSGSVFSTWPSKLCKEYIPGQLESRMAALPRGRREREGKMAASSNICEPGLPNSSGRWSQKGTLCHLQFKPIAQSFGSQPRRAAPSFTTSIPGRPQSPFGVGQHDFRGSPKSSRSPVCGDHDAVEAMLRLPIGLRSTPAQCVRLRATFHMVCTQNSTSS